MQSVPEPEQHHLLVQQKLKDSFGPSYMTALSVIQAAALADLALVVAGNYQHFTPTQWLQVLLSFGIFIFYWNQYTMHSALWEWIPDLRDAAIPFVTGGFELLLNHTIPLSLSLWLFAAAAMLAIGAATTWHTILRAGEEAENSRLLALLSRQHRLSGLYLLAGSALLLLFAGVIYVGNVQASDVVQSGRGLLALALILLVVAYLSVFGIVSIRYWHLVVTYARTGYMPGMKTEDRST
jgi:hypothetical protein